MSWTESHSLEKGAGALKKRRKRQGRNKDGRLYNLWLSQQTISPLFSVWGGGKEGAAIESRGDREREAARAMLFYGSCHMDEGAARPWERTLTFNNRASTGPPGPFSPERRTPQGAIRAWIGAWQPCAAPQGIHKRWHIDSPCLCTASMWKREELEGWDSFYLINLNISDNMNVLWFPEHCLRICINYCFERIFFVDIAENAPSNTANAHYFSLITCYKNNPLDGRHKTGLLLRRLSWALH